MVETPDLRVDPQPVRPRSNAKHRRSTDFGPTTFRVAIELKGAWNDETLAAQDEQLAAHYLPAVNTGVGLYIVGWFPLEQWDGNDGPRKAAAKHETAEKLLDELTRQASEIALNRGFAVTPIVLTIPRPVPSS
jgi:hypothetical protein